MKALLTGGAGFVGSHLAEALLAQGHGVIVVDDLSTGSMDNIAHLKGRPGFEYVIDTVMNDPLMGELVDRARAVALVFRLARQERDVWLGWPARVAALMAAELGVDAHALQTVLETHVREHLGSLAEVRPELG